MSDLISRLDKFVIALLAEAEQRCDVPPSGVTSDGSEEATGSSPARATITERVAVLKAACQYLALREKIDEGDSQGGEEREPEIVSIERAIRNNRARKR